MLESLEKIRFSLPETMEHLFSMYADKAEEKNIAYQLDVCNIPVSFVIGDPTRLSQILLNLLSNDGRPLNEIIAEIPQ